MVKRQRFTIAFKVEAIRLWKSSGRPATAVARELGLRRHHLYQWQTELENLGEMRVLTRPPRVTGGIPRPLEIRGRRSLNSAYGSLPNGSRLGTRSDRPR